MANGADSPHQTRPLIEALFLDVPYVIDRVWRWAEYYAHRLGCVALDDDAHPWQARSLTRTSLFAVYALMTAFIAFGPTFNSLCGILGPPGARSLAQFVTGLFIVAAALIALRMMAAIVIVLKQRVSKEPANFNAKTAKLNLSDWKRLITAGLILFVFTIGCTVAPFIAALVAFHHLAPDAATCRQLPDATAIGWQLAITLSMIAIGAWLLATKRLRSAARRLVLVLTTWLAGVAVMWWLAGPDGREADPGPYRHIYPILVGLLMLVALLARWWATFLMESMARTLRAGQDEWFTPFRKRVQITELLSVDATDPDIGVYRIAASFVIGVGARPMQALLLPALVAMMAPTQWLPIATAVTFGCGALLLAYGNLSNRWQQLITYVERWFLVGLPLPISVFVIAMGALRLLDVQYASTILDAAPFGTLLAGVMMCYLAAWFFEYWINRWPAEHLLAALGAPEHGRDGVLELHSQIPAPPIGLQPSGRTLAIHGAGRLCAQGWRQNDQPFTRGNPQREPVFETYGFQDLFQALSWPGDDPNILHSLQRVLRLYFYTINALLVAIGAGLLWLHGTYAAPLAAHPVVAAQVASAQPQPDDLIALLRRQALQSRPAIVVAASGGGTRAAVYTARALEGLAGLDRTRDVVLVSGVSGGGVAGAWFVTHYDELGGAKRNHEQAWKDYVTAVGQPFIIDVLNGSTELRVAGDVSLGELLAESFRRRLFNDLTLGDLRGPRLILNTTVSGHPVEDSQLLNGRFALATTDDDSGPFSSLAGSRLIFTTLASDAGFPGRATDAGYPDQDTARADVRMPYTLVRDTKVPVAAAAALNANFPPVFPNARVSLSEVDRQGCHHRSYFVTDGGATENLGLVSALYALRGALLNWPDEAALPVIHIVAAEASAIGYDYSQDHGIGAAMDGAKERVTGALTQELIEDINHRLLANKAQPLHIHFLTLPMAFRSRGGFGTHWMYADTFRIANPLVREMPGRLMASLKQTFTSRRYYQTLKRDDIDTLWPALFSASGNFCTSHDTWSASANQVAEWICGKDSTHPLKADPDAQIDAWNAVVGELGNHRDRLPDQ